MSAAAPGPGTQAKWGQKRRRRESRAHVQWQSVPTLRGSLALNSNSAWDTKFRQCGLKELSIAVVAGFLP